MKTVVLKKYDNPFEAYVDAEKLRSENIDCEVMEDTSFSSLLPGTCHLVVLEDVEIKAKEILSSEEK